MKLWGYFHGTEISEEFNSYFLFEISPSKHPSTTAATNITQYLIAYEIPHIAGVWLW